MLHSLTPKKKIEAISYHLLNLAHIHSSACRHARIHTCTHATRTHTHTYIQRERDRQTDRQTDRDRERQRETETEGDRDRETGRKR